MRAPLTQWTVDGSARGMSATLVIDLSAGGPDVNVVATLPGEPGVTDFTGYFRFDHPPYSENNRVQTDEDTRAFALDPNNSRTTEANDEGTTSNWLGGSDIRTALLPVLQSLGPNTAVSIEGFASYEGPHLQPWTKPSEPITRIWQDAAHSDFVQSSKTSSATQRTICRANTLLSPMRPT